MSITSLQGQSGIYEEEADACKGQIIKTQRTGSYTNARDGKHAQDLYKFKPDKTLALRKGSGHKVQPPTNQLLENGK